MTIKVEKRNNKLVVVIPNTYKEPYWLDNIYKYGHKEPKYVIEEDGTIVIECRDAPVTITKPIVQQTPVGVVQTIQTINENWVYFDVPELSILVNENDILTDEWTLDELKIQEKEKILLENEKSIDNTN